MPCTCARDCVVLGGIDAQTLRARSADAVGWAGSKELFAQRSRGFTFVEAALIPYLAIFVFSPFSVGVRIVFPVVPWIGYLALSGLKGVVEKRAPRYSPGAAWALILLMAVPYGQFYRKDKFDPIRETSGLPEFNQLC